MTPSQAMKTISFLNSTFVPSLAKKRKKNYVIKVTSKEIHGNKPNKTGIHETQGSKNYCRNFVNLEILFGKKGVKSEKTHTLYTIMLINPSY